jgi:putative PIG3 family NAD(P)H quinone oxidoreductase
MTEPGAPDVLHVTDVPDAVPGDGEVLIEVAAAGVNRADLLQRQGRYAPPPGASPYLGLECSGRVRALGGGVGTWRVGDAVCALLPGGGYAQLVNAQAEHVMPIPDGVTVVEAASLPEAACTVWSNLVMTAQLAAGEHVLIHGGASGIGTFAIQVARLVGAIPVVTVGSDSKGDRCLQLGAERAINYRNDDFVEEVMTSTGGRGVDVILDIVGAKYLAPNLRSLAPDGRLVVIGLQGGVKREVDLGRMLSKRLTVYGTTLRSRSNAAKGRIVDAVVSHLWPAIGRGQIRPVIDRTLPLREVAQAHEALEQGETVGKVVLTL